MDTLKVELGRRAVKIISEYDQWELVLFLCFVGFIIFILGYVFHWVIKNKQIKSETQKLISEAEKNAIEAADKKVSLIERNQAFRKKHTENSRLVAFSLRAAIDLMKQNELKKFDEQREEALNLFYSDFIQSFIDYLEVSIAIYKGNELCDFVKNEIFPFLDTVGNFLESINIDQILIAINRTKALIKQSTLNYIITKTEKSIPFFSFSMKKEFKSKLTRIEKYYE